MITKTPVRLRTPGKGQPPPEPENDHPAEEYEGLSTHFRMGPWRDAVKARSTRLRSEARWLPPEGMRRPRKAQRVEVEVFVPLARVDEIVGRDRVWPGEWFSGRQVEDCWRLLRQAEEGILRIVDDKGLLLKAPAVLDYGEAVLGHDHVAVRRLAAALRDGKRKQDAATLPALREQALDVLTAAHEASDRQHRDLRAFRNQLIGVSVVLLLLAGLALFGQARMDDSVLPSVERGDVLADESVPPSPAGQGAVSEAAAPETANNRASDESAAAEGAGEVAVADGEPGTGEMSPVFLLAFVMFFGCTGALFTAVPSLAQMPEKVTPFNLGRQQALLKVVTGAWSAVIGLMIVGAGLVATSQVTSLAGLALLAVVFGAGQEAVTSFVDRRAGIILSKV